MTEPTLTWPLAAPADYGTFFLCAAGAIGPNHLSVTWEDQPQPTDPDLEAIIEAAWSAAIDDARTTGARLYDGPLCRLDTYALAGDGLSLSLSTTSYRRFLGTNSANADLRFTRGPHVLADPLGVSGLVLTNDGQILLPRRSRTVAEYPDMLHPFGGCVEPRDDARPPDPFESIRTELAEETSLAGRDVLDITCLGMLRDKRSYQPEMVFDLSVTVDAATVRARAAQADDAHEHAEILTVADDPVLVAQLLEAHLPEMTPATPGALVLHGRRRWGQSWLAAVVARLKSRLQE